MEENKMEQVSGGQDKSKREVCGIGILLLLFSFVAAVLSGYVLMKGTTQKDTIFHIFYIGSFVVLFVLYLLFHKHWKKIIEIEDRKKRIAFDFLDMIRVTLIACFVAIFILDFFKLNVVHGESMDPTLHNQEKLILGTHTYKFEDMKRHDVVVCDAPKLDELIIKRLIGLPGDHIVIKNDVLYVNDEQQKESYINEEMTNNEDLDLTVPKGKIFVMGDNRNNSTDSRSELVGLVDIEKQLKGKIVFQSLFGIKE